MTAAPVPAPAERVELPRRGFDPAFRLMEIVFRPPMRLWFNWRFAGLENIPPYGNGPVLIACNHVSNFDPPALGHPLYLRGYRARYLAKSELFKHPIANFWLRAAGQVPVERGTGSSKPLEEASRLLNENEAVILFPEGTITREPDYSQGPTKTGIARLALSTGLPVTPMAIWGTHRIFSTGGKMFPPFGLSIWFSVGEPMHVEGSVEDPTALRSITDEIMAEVARLTDGLREHYPEHRS